MTTTTTSNGQLVLPGQAAAPDGPVDLTPMFAMHFAFRRDLAAFAAAAERTPVADRRTWRALHRRWQRFAMVLHHHHAGEDAGIWPVLLDRSRQAGDDEAVAHLEAMEAEHAEIDPLLERCAADLAVLDVTADEDARAALQVRLVGARERLGAHLAHEERDALAVVQRRLTAADWARIEREHFQRTATLPYLRYVVPWVMHGMPEQGRRRFTSFGGLAVRLLELALRPSFLRLERAAFRHVRTGGR